MENKYKLKNKGIFIENDLTIEERATQFNLREIVREEKQKGNTVKISYKKIHINGNTYEWKKGTGLIKTTQKREERPAQGSDKPKTTNPRITNKVQQLGNDHAMEKARE